MIHSAYFSATTKTFLMLILSFFIGQAPFAMLVAEDSSGPAASALFQDSMDDLSVVAGFGVGGGVLGLSTLSFMSEPAKNLNNILIGASLGIIVGVAVVAWNQASKTHDTVMTAEHADQVRSLYTSNGLGARLERLKYESGRGKEWMLFKFSYPF